MSGAVAVRNAASVILVRDRASEPRILMGQRSGRARFMPGVFVFPGGAVDAADAEVPLASSIGEPCLGRLHDGADPALATALQVAAIREVCEETGLLLGRPGHWPDSPPPGWEAFGENARVPCAGAFRFVFRAITPPGPPRRFDARFFLVDADATVPDADLDDFSRAADELSALHWVRLDDVRELRLAFITSLALETTLPLLAHDDPPDSVPCIAGEREQILRQAHPDSDRFAY